MWALGRFRLNSGVRPQGNLVDALEHKIPPPVVGLLVAAAMWAVAKANPSLTLPASIYLSLGAALLALSGIAVAAAGVVAFRRSETTIDPLKPETTTSLVIGGIYSVTRNPMYLGMLLVLGAWMVFLGSLPALVGPAAFALYITRFQIIPEERALSALFGDAFTAYAAKVRRWL
jgi:protein-S-isoprenylcysteine O-methyltransferase Ste14